MKRLTEYISHVKDLHSLNEYLNERLVVNQRFDEKLVINKNYSPYTCAAVSFDELRKIIEKRYKEQGPGTEQNPIDFNDIDISKINSFYNEKNGIGIFERTKFEYIDISNWIVSNVKYMDSMFFNCEKLKSIGDLSEWDVSSVKDTHCMFYCCEKLESVGDLSNWDISNVKNINGMFVCCKELKSVGDLSKWNVSNVEDMYNVFYNSGITNKPSWYKK